MATSNNTVITSVAEWKAIFLPNSESEAAEDETPKLMWMAHVAALRAVREVRGKPAKQRQRTKSTAKR